MSKNSQPIAKTTPGFQPVSAAIPDLHTRPFAPRQEEDELDDQSEVEEAARARVQAMTLTSIPVLPPDSPSPVQRQSEIEEQDEAQKVQPKLKIGAPGDGYEQEAARMAARVIAMPSKGVGVRKDGGTGAQGENLPEPVQREPVAEEEVLEDSLKVKPQIQAKGKAPAVPEGFDRKLAQHKGGGQSLSDETRAFMEPRFGADFSGVRVHEAPELASGIHAQAFTHGQDVYFNAGKYNPGSSGGKELLAHELTHVVQQIGDVTQAKSIQNKQEAELQEEGLQSVQDEQVSTLTSKDLSDKNSPQITSPQAATQSEQAIGDSANLERAISDIDPAEKEKKKTELLVEKTPEIEQKKQALQQVGQEAQQASQEAEKSSESTGETKTPPAPKAQTEKSEKEQTEKTEEGAQPSQSGSQQQAPAELTDSPALPEQPQAVIPPEPVIPIDAGGMPLPGNPEADIQINQLVQQAQSLRDGGNQLLAQAAQIRSNAQIIRGNIQLVKQGVSQAERGVATSTEHLGFRQQTVEQAKQARDISEQKAAMVAEQAPGFTDKANQGQEKTQPMVSQANELVGESAANTPEDSEAAGKSQEQGQKLNKVATDTATMDEAFSQTKTRAEGLAAEAAQAQGMNAQTTAQIGSMESTLEQSQARLAQMSEQNQQAHTQAESLAGKPDEMVSQAAVLEEKGRALIQASIEIEQQIQQIQSEYQQAMSSVPAEKATEQTGGSESEVIQRDVEEGRYDERESIDLVGGVSEAAPWLTGVDPATEEQRQAAVEAVEARRQQQIAQINSIAGGSFEELSAGQKMGLSLELMGQNIADSLSNIEWPDWRQLALSLIDPRTALIGVVGGLSQILSGGANLLSAEQWSKDPLGNFLKSSADIATGLTIILGSITALAGVIIAIMGAATLLTLGLAAGVTGPVIAFCTTVMTIVGGMTLKVGLVAAALHSLVLIKNLVDAATAETAEDLQNQSEQMTEDTKNAGGALVQAGMGKLAQLGGRKLQGRIADAGGGTAYAAAMPGRVATQVSNAGQRLGRTFGRGGRAPASDPGLANRGYRPKPGERSMTREQWREQDPARGHRATTRDPALLDRDRSYRRTQHLTEWRRSIHRSQIASERRLFLGDDYVKVGPGKWRSLDGTRQFRVKPADYLGEHGIGQPQVPNIPHLHLEFLTRSGNRFRVARNIHIPLE